MIDTHLHGYRSSDSDTEYEKIIQSAISRGLTGICFTEHYEYYPFNNRMSCFDVDDYLSEIGTLKQKYNNLKILSGLEFSLYKSVFDMTDCDKTIYTMNNYDFDSIIGSVHYVDINSSPEDIYYCEYTAKYNKSEAYKKVLEQYIALLPRLPGINIIGHFDYVTRYSQTYDDRNIYYKDFSDLFDELFKIIIDMGIALEINTANYIKRDDRPENVLDINILKRYRELGGEMVSLGSDAHTPDRIAQKFDEFTQIIKSSGFSYLTHFENRKAILTKI